MAMGLNFKDVLVALRQIEDNMGRECSGIVADVGSEVTRPKIGAFRYLIYCRMLWISCEKEGSDLLRR